MKRKVFLALVLALVLLFSVVPASASSVTPPEGQVAGDSYIITGDVTSFEQVNLFIREYPEVVITGNVLTNDFAAFDGWGSESIAAVRVVQTATGHGEYPTKILPAYNGGFSLSRNTRMSVGHTFSQDYKWETGLRYVYALNGNNTKAVTIDHEVVDENGQKMLVNATTVVNTEKNADNIIRMTFTPDDNGIVKYARVIYNNVISAWTNEGPEEGSAFSISKSYRYDLSPVWYSSVKLDLNPTVLGGFKIVKTDSTNDKTPLSGAKFKVYTDASCTTETEATRYDAGTDSWVAVGEVTTGSDGTVTVTNLKAGTYYVKETEAPAHYIIDDARAKTVTVETPTVSLSLTGGEGTTLANIDADSVTARSTWNDFGAIEGKTNTLPLIKDTATSSASAADYDADVFIKGGGNTVSVTSDGSISADELVNAYAELGGAKFNVTVGNAVVETVDTVAEAVQYVNNTLIANGFIDKEGYRNHVSITPTVTKLIYAPKSNANVNTVEFTDTATIDFTVNKSWINETLPQRGEYIQVQLYKILAGTEDPGSPWGDPVELNEDNNWSYTWTDLDPNADYKVEEVEVPVGYELVDTEYEVGKTEDGRIRITAEMTNSQIVDVEVNKSWFNDTPAQRGEYLIVQLYCDGEPYGDPIELTEKEGWSYRWEGLEGGHKYTVDEPQVPADYVKKIVDPKAGVDEETGRVLITCEISNTHADSPITFDDSTILICLSVALIIAVAYLAIKIKQTPTK